jgi:hypothetical protein
MTNSMYSLSALSNTVHLLIKILTSAMLMSVSVSSYAQLPELGLPLTATGVLTTARFFGGASADNGISYKSNFGYSEPIDVSAEILVEPAHANTIGNLYVVVALGQQYLMRDQNGAFRPWDQTLGTLLATSPAKTLRANERLDIVNDVALGPEGVSGVSVSVFVAYDSVVAPGQLFYSGAPLTFSICARGTNTDSDGDCEPDSSDVYPFNPFKKIDDWGKKVDRYPQVFAASDISAINREGLIGDLKLAADYFGKYDVEWWAIGKDVNAMLALAGIWCDRRIERGQLFYFRSLRLDLTRLRSVCLSEVAHPHASLEWNNNTATGRAFFTSDLSTYLGWMERYRQISLNLPRSSVNAGNRRTESYTATQSSMFFQYDTTTNPSEWRIGKEGASLTVFHEYYHTAQANAVFSTLEVVDETGNTIRPEYGPTAFSEGSANYISAYTVMKLAQDGIYKLSTPDYTLRERMRNEMRTLQSMLPNCPDFEIQKLNYGNKCDPYTFGMWATAYLTHKARNINVFHQILWPKINSLTYRLAFEDTFGLSYGQFNEEFRKFLALPIDEQLAIVPDINLK